MDASLQEQLDRANAILASAAATIKTLKSKLAAVGSDVTTDECKDAAKTLSVSIDNLERTMSE